MMADLGSKYLPLQEGSNIVVSTLCFLPVYLSLSAGKTWGGMEGLGVGAEVLGSHCLALALPPPTTTTSHHPCKS